MKEQAKKYWEDNRKEIILRMATNAFVFALAIAFFLFLARILTGDTWPWILYLVVYSIPIFVVSYISSQKMPQIFWVWGLPFIPIVILFFAVTFLGNGTGRVDGSLGAFIISFLVSLLFYLPSFLGGLFGSKNIKSLK